jgi:hypothetical protein
MTDSEFDNNEHGKVKAFLIALALIIIAAIYSITLVFKAYKTVERTKESGISIADSIIKSNKEIIGLTLSCDTINNAVVRITHTNFPFDSINNLIQNEKHNTRLAN